MKIHQPSELQELGLATSGIRVMIAKSTLWYNVKKKVCVGVWVIHYAICHDVQLAKLEIMIRISFKA